MTAMEDTLSNQLFEILETRFKDLMKAMRYLEDNEEALPLTGFIELRDVMHHLVSFIEASREHNGEKQHEQIVSLKEHFRRGIAETYQQTYENLANVVFDSYSKYRYRARQYERVFFLDRKFSDLHNMVEKKIKEAKAAWMAGRELKNSDFNSADFKTSLENFKKAYTILKGVQPIVDQLWSVFNQRVLYSILFGIVGLILCVAFVF